MTFEDCVFEDCTNIAMLRCADNVTFRNNKYVEGSYITEDFCGKITLDAEVRCDKGSMSR